MAVMADASGAVSMDFKTAGNLIYILGDTYDELGGSEYFAHLGYIGNKSPIVRPETAFKLMNSLSLATSKGLVRACHDLSEGGLGVALAEMAFAGGLGAEAALDKMPQGEEICRDDVLLFSESNSRFLAEVAPDKQQEFEETMRGNAFALIGSVTYSDTLIIKGLNDKKVISLPVKTLKEAWQKPLRW
jgi:phosphoribosylformylglycinamidine synthase